MTDGTAGPTSTHAPSPDALARAGHRSVFAVVEGWAWCPHCGLKIERSALEATSGLEAGEGDARWRAVACPRCHARGRVRPGEASD